MKPQHDLRAGEYLVRAEHKVADFDWRFWGDIADMLNAAASRFDVLDQDRGPLPTSREMRELNRLVSLANHYMAAHGLNRDGSYTRRGIEAMLSGVGLTGADAERFIHQAGIDGRSEFCVDRRTVGLSTLEEAWRFAVVTEGAGFELLELEHEVPEKVGS